MKATVLVEQDEVSGDSACVGAEERLMFFDSQIDMRCYQAKKEIHRMVSLAMGKLPEDPVLVRERDARIAWLRDHPEDDE